MFFFLVTIVKPGSTKTKKPNTNKTIYVSQSRGRSGWVFTSRISLMLLCDVHCVAYVDFRLKLFPFALFVCNSNTSPRFRACEHTVGDSSARATRAPNLVPCLRCVCNEMRETSDVEQQRGVEGARGVVRSTDTSRRIPPLSLTCKRYRGNVPSECRIIRSQ